jgi:peptidoglycan hydrolase-like protein with peptidoglycan-binding domain
MKIIANKYPESRDTTYITFSDGVTTMVSVFLRRALAYFKDNNIKVSGYGYRSIQKQAELYLAWINDPTHNNRAAYPGQSWHNIALAFDVNSQGKNPDGSNHYPATMDEDFLLAPDKQEMNKWGICIPMWKGSSNPEPWQIQPIETIGQNNPQWFIDEDDYMNTSSGYRNLSLVVIPNWTGDPVYMEGEDVRRAERAFVAPENGIFNSTCQSACKAFQTKNGLTADGACGPLTWAKINAILGPYTDWEAKYNECKVQLDAANSTIALLNAKITQLTLQNQGLTAQNQTLTDQNQQLTEQNQGLIAQNAALSIQNQNLTDENTALKKQNISLVSENKSLQDKNEELEGQVTGLIQQNADLKGENEALIESYNELHTIVTNYNSAAQKVAEIGTE